MQPPNPAPFGIHRRRHKCETRLLLSSSSSSRLHLVLSCSKFVGGRPFQQDMRSKPASVRSDSQGKKKHIEWQDSWAPIHQSSFFQRRARSSRSLVAGRMMTSRELPPTPMVSAQGIKEEIAHDPFAPLGNACHLTFAKDKMRLSNFILISLSLGLQGPFRHL